MADKPGRLGERRRDIRHLLREANHAIQALSDLVTGPEQPGVAELVSKALV
jgi:hypothetical protein